MGYRPARVDGASRFRSAGERDRGDRGSATTPPPPQPNPNVGTGTENHIPGMPIANRACAGGGASQPMTN